MAVNDFRRQITPIDAALEWIDYLEGKPDRNEYEEWQLESWKLYRDGKAATLEKAMGLAVGPGEARQRLCYVYPIRKRNQLIREAAASLSADYDATVTAKLIDFAMNKGLPALYMRDQDKHTAKVSLCKLRYFCMNHKGDEKLEVGWQRVLQIMAGDGC